MPNMPRKLIVGALLALVPLFPVAAHKPTPGNPAAASTHPAAALIQQSIRASRSNPDDSMRLANSALEQLAVQPDVDLDIRARLALCDYYSERNLDRARELLAQINAQLPLAHRAGLRAGARNCEGEIHEAGGDNAQALSTFEAAVSAAEAADDDELLADALYLRGWLRGVQGEYALGLHDMQRSLALYEKGDFPEHSRTAVNGIASIYNRMGDYAQAQQYFELASKAQLAAGLSREAVVSLYNLGRSRENLGQLDGAQRVYQQVLELSRRIGYARGQAYALRGLASVLIARGEWARALERLDEADRHAAVTPDARLQAQLALARGIALRGRRKPAESVAVLNSALATFGKAGSLAEMAATHEALAAAQADLGDWRGAYENQRRQKQIGDRLHRQQVDQRVLTLKVGFDAVAKEKENAHLLREMEATEAALAQEQQSGELRIVAVSLAVLMALLLGLLAWRHHRISRAMRALAMTDELTGLPNRRAVLARLAELLAAGRSCAVMIVDIDHFKTINDRHGHLIGDEVLRAVAGEVARALQAPMFAGRLGGEEFLVLLPGADLDAATRVAEQMRAAMAALPTARWFDGPPLSISAGVALARPAPGGVADALRRADEALYEAKAAGRNRVHAGKLVLAA